LKVSEELLKILVCPQTKASLVQDGEWLYSTDPETRRRYPIMDGIPVLLIDQSQVVDEMEFHRVMSQSSGRRNAAVS